MMEVSLDSKSSSLSVTQISGKKTLIITPAVESTIVRTRSGLKLHELKDAPRKSVLIPGTDLFLELPAGTWYVIVDNGVAEVVTREIYLSEQADVGGFHDGDTIPKDFSGSNGKGWGGDGADEEDNETLGRVITVN